MDNKSPSTLYLKNYEFVESFPVQNISLGSSNWRRLRSQDKSTRRTGSSGCCGSSEAEPAGQASPRPPQQHGTHRKEISLRHQIQRNRSIKLNF